MQKKVTVLLSTYNGEKYLTEQINSIINQREVYVEIFARDDCSSDKTTEILDQYKNKGVVKWYTGKNLGAARSFLDLIKNAPESEYYAFCDQDDVWNDNKLIWAVKALDAMNDAEKPLLYCSGYQLVDAELNPLPDNGHVSTTKFSEALVVSNCTGCTTVFNKRLVEIVRKGNPDSLVMHDDWIHKVCLAVGGKVIYDPRKTLLYRQHGNNVDGGIHGIGSRVNNLKKRISKKDRIRSRQIAEVIRIYGDFMDENNLELAKAVSEYADMGFVDRWKLAFSTKITTPYPRLNRGFRVAILLRYY